MNWTSWEFWRFRMMELAVAIVIAFGVIYFTNLVTNQYRASIPPNAWLAVAEIFVPDHEVAEDPMIIYDRIVRQDFPGMWVVEVQKQEPGALFSPACVGSGVTEYRVDTVLPDRRVSLSWFVGKHCYLRAGTYRIRATWTIQLPEWPEKKTAYTSNLFRVLPSQTPATLPIR